MKYIIRSRKHWLFLFSFGVLFCQSLITPPFEVPDEQSHYATIHYLKNEGVMPTLAKNADLSLEEERAEYLLGIMSEGHNAYSHHPEFRLPPGTGDEGVYEREIIGLNSEALRKTYTIHQAAIYPPLYYWITYPFYTVVASADILTRLFVSRLSSVLLTAIMIVFAYLIGKLIFKEEHYAYTLALMTLCFPMTTYLGSGVTSDNLHNLLFTIFLYLTLLLLKKGWTTREFFATGVVIGLDILTKPQAYVMIPMLGLALALSWKRLHKGSVIGQISLTALTIFLLAGWFKQPQYLATGSGFVAKIAPYGGWHNFVVFSREYFSLFTGAMLVWYWGVFKWFGVVLPHPVWWIANRLILCSVGGLLLSFLRDLRRKKFSETNQIVVFMLLANLGYLGALIWFDWQFYEQIGRSLGFQARYLMPLLTTQMFLFLYGITSFSWSARSKEWIRRSMIVFFVLLQFIGVYTLVTSYYDLLPVTTFIGQLSQYKPFYAKAAWWYLWIPLYLTASLGCIWLTKREDQGEQS